MASFNVTTPGNDSNDKSSTDITMFLKIFAGETLAAYARTSKTAGKHLEISVKKAKSAQFPVMGRGKAKFLKPGDELNGQEFKQTEKVIQIDGLLTADCFVSDLYEAMSQDAFRAMYAAQLGESLAIAKDQHVLAEAAKMVVAGVENLEGLGKPVLADVGVMPDFTLEGHDAILKWGSMFVLQMQAVAARFDKNYVPKAERYAFIIPEVKAVLLRYLSAAGLDTNGAAFVSQWGDITIAGIPLIDVPHLGDSGVDFSNSLNSVGHKFPEKYAGKTYAVVFHKGAVGTLNLMSMGFETQRYSTRQAEHLVAKMSTGHGGLRPEASAMLVGIGEIPEVPKSRASK
ncbi:hypothetical protein [Chromobacterium haemolyticum]|uniref:hypothetical protein n=1 Tax=Chromobacterium haemolyticum TaxID=394935 RepID=UPI0009DB61BF|nr:hypothetical protein [Chromobacterium haemolyticum]OQS44854.1 hypothetical protein B0T39_00990 [Chromobacterium haemolyticum]PTU68620.1 phage capsid protein [Chromobacterium haemolyticum]